MKTGFSNPRVWHVLVVVVATVSIAAARPASAQAADDGFSFGLGGGFANASSSPFETSTTGYYVLSSLATPSPLRMIRPRADLLFADWGSSRLTALTGNLLFTPLSTKRIAPYALAGAGAYAVPGTTLKSGWTLGFGLRLPGEARTITIDSRVHALLRGTRDAVPIDASGRWRYVWMPIGLGIHF